MGVLKKDKATVRIQMDFSVDAARRLKDLKAKTDASSYAEVAKNAFRLYERMIELAEEGNDFLARDKSGNVRQLELFLP